MARKTIAVSCLLAGLVLAGCDRQPSEAERTPEPVSEPPEQATEQATPAPQFKAFGGLARIEDKTLEVVRGYTAQFYDGELAALHGRFTPEFGESLTLEMLTELRENVADAYGQELEVLGEESQVKGEYRGFARWSKFEKFDGVVQLQWILVEDDSIAGFFVQPGEQPES